MTAPAVQHFFETPLIERHLDAPTVESVTAAALELAARYTFDVSQPTAARFEWLAQTRVVDIAPGSGEPLVSTSGGFWVAVCCIAAGNGSGGLVIEDPRLLTAAAGPPGLAVSAEPTIATIAPVAGTLSFFQGFLRHGMLPNRGDSPQHWVITTLRPSLIRPNEGH